MAGPLKINARLNRYVRSEVDSTWGYISNRARLMENIHVVFGFDPGKQGMTICLDSKPEKIW